jgi:hypothetical protein
MFVCVEKMPVLIFAPLIDLLLREEGLTVREVHMRGTFFFRCFAWGVVDVGGMYITN